MTLHTACQHTLTEPRQSKTASLVTGEKKKLFFFSKAFGRVTTACARQKTAFFSASYQLRFQCMWSCAVNRDGNSDKQVVCALLEPSSASSGEA